MLDNRSDSKSTPPLVAPATARAFVGLCWVLIIGVWLLERQAAESLWLGAILAYGPQAFWPTPVALAVIAALLSRDRGASIKALLLVIFMFVFLLGLNLPIPARAHGGQRLTIITWNVYNQFKRADEFKAECERRGADVVLLQEAFDRQWRKTFSDWQGVPWHDGWIFTRGQLAAGGLIPCGDSWRKACWAHLRFGTRDIAILNTHFTSGVAEGLPIVRFEGGDETRFSATRNSRRRQIDTCVAWAEAQRMPFILAGDFNTPSNSARWLPVRAIAQDAFAARGVGFGYTYSTKLPLWRIDYVWASRDFRVLHCETIGGKLSDHHGVCAELEFLR
jgi:endonuclease/exonuclease/phosphatase (EEP) superfamily protein YafD